MTEAVTREFTPAELARVIADIIRYQTGRWEQGSWFCKPGWTRQGERDEWGERKLVPIPVEKVRESLVPGSTCASTACVAGWAAILTSPIGTVIVDTCYLRLPGATNTESLEDQGQEALGLSHRQASWLFSGARERPEVLAALDAIAAGEDWEPGEFDVSGLDEDDDDEL